jgi:hypothetical protein
MSCENSASIASDDNQNNSQSRILSTKAFRCWARASASRIEKLSTHLQIGFAKKKPEKTFLAPKANLLHVKSISYRVTEKEFCSISP